MAARVVALTPLFAGAVGVDCGDHINNNGNTTAGMPLNATDACNCRDQCTKVNGAVGWTWVADGRCYCRSDWGADVNNCDCYSAKIEAPTPPAPAAGGFVHHEFCMDPGCSEQCVLNTYPIGVCLPAGPTMSSKVLSNETSIIEHDYNDSSCGTVLRTSVSPRDKCTNQADEPGNMGKCGYKKEGDNSSCWQDLTVVAEVAPPAKNFALRRWLCDETCTNCNFNETIEVNQCVTTSSPLGPPVDMKKIECLHGMPYGAAVRIQTWTSQAEKRTCFGQSDDKVIKVNECTAGDFGTHEIWMPTETCHL